MERLLYFKEWNLNEKDNFNDKVKNWLSKNLGGRVSKIDSILSDIQNLEISYIEEWEDILTDIDALEVEKTQAKSDPAEIKKLDRMIERKTNLISALEDKHSKKIKSIYAKAENIAKGNDRLSDYLSLEKSKLEADLAEKVYNKSKEIADDTISRSLYKKYERARDKAAKQDKSFLDKYKKGGFDDIPVKPDTFNYSMDSFVKMDKDRFESSVKNMNPKSVKDLIKYLRRERNERYAMMDTEKESLSKKAKAAKGDVKSKIENKIKELSSRYMNEIRDLRTKITIARRYE